MLGAKMHTVYCLLLACCSAVHEWPIALGSSPHGPSGPSILSCLNFQWVAISNRLRLSQLVNFCIKFIILFASGLRFCFVTFQTLFGSQRNYLHFADCDSFCIASARRFACHKANCLPSPGTQIYVCLYRGTRT